MITEQELQRSMTVIRGMWMALFTSLLICVIPLLAPTALNHVNFTFSDQGYRTLRLAFFGVALLILVLTWVVRRNLLKNARPNNPTPSERHPAISRYTFVTVITLAMSQWVGICGLILYVLGRHRPDLYLLTLLSAAAMLLYFPKKEEVRRLAQEMASQQRS